MLIAVAILRARELSIRQHIMLLTVTVIELYIVHASFRVDGESISVLTYYVNRFLKYFLYFFKPLYLLCFPCLLGQPDADLLNEHYHDYEKCDRRPKNIFLVTVITVLKCYRAESAATYYAGHCRVT